MSDDRNVWIGADPGGKGKFGVAVLSSDGMTQTWCVDCVDDAIETITQNVSITPDGVGIDAPLWWSSGLSGDRMADRWIRNNYRVGSSVQTTNSLRGAAVVQGPFLIARIREHFPAVRVTEVHPKALLIAMGLSWIEFAARFSVHPQHNSEHERDAIISAVAAREGFDGRWTRDLSTERLPSEQEPSEYWLNPVHYFWPN